MASILGGVRDILDQNLTDNKMNGKLLGAAIKQIEENWHGNKTSSRKNWGLRFVPLPKDTSKQKEGHGHKAEVPLERSIARAFEGMETLWNQMPVASGLVEVTLDGKRKAVGKRRAVDLIYKPDASKDAYEFLELKVANNKNDTTMDAVIEIIEYGLLYLFSRLYAGKLGYSPNKQPILWASRIGLRVLAERKYYENPKNQTCDNYALVNELNNALKEFLNSKPKEFDGFEMDFKFEIFPSNFECPEIDGTELNENLMGSLRNAICKKEVYSIKPI